MILDERKKKFSTRFSGSVERLQMKEGVKGCRWGESFNEVPAELPSEGFQSETFQVDTFKFPTKSVPSWKSSRRVNFGSNFKAAGLSIYQ